ncbi:hypothetical protein BDZ97DRAFT_1651902, partial [Flammula alnicola]
IYRSRWTTLKVVYLLCRYFPLLSWSIILWTLVGDHDLKTCIPAIVVQQVFFIPLQFFPQCVLIMRAWAFSGRKRTTLVLLLPCLGGYLGLQIWGYATHVNLSRQIFVIFGHTGCFRNQSSNDKEFAVSIPKNLFNGRRI